MTLLDAIAAPADSRITPTRRRCTSCATKPESTRKIPVHYKEALKGDSQFNLALKPGDTIVVP